MRYGREISPATWDAINAALRAGESGTVIAKRHGVSPASVSRIRRGVQPRGVEAPPVAKLAAKSLPHKDGPSYHRSVTLTHYQCVRLADGVLLGGSASLERVTRLAHVINREGVGEPVCGIFSRGVAT